MIDVRLQHRLKRGGFELQVEFQSDARCLALCGPSGAGKSSTLACIAGLIRPDAGHVKLGDDVLLDRSAGIDVPTHRRRIGLVLQDAALFPLHSVRGNLLYGHTGDGPFQLDRVAGLLEIAHLLDRLPRNLSGGERQRVALGRALLSHPRLLLADEPFAALDAPRRERMTAALLRIRDELGVPMVLVTHDEALVSALADDVHRMA